MEKKGSKKLVIGVIAVIVIIAALLGIYRANAPQATAGAKHVIIEVVDDAGASTSYEADTDAEYLSEVFDEIDDLTVEGETSDYGLYIDTVNGLYADYSADGAYWSILVNGEYGEYGADSQPVTDGDTYSLVYTIYEG